MSNHDIIDEEYSFDVRAIISETDKNGNIVFANRGFREVSGFSLPEIMGKSHNIIRHPDVPRQVFEEMWSTISNGGSWHGILKNRRSDGRYYWLETEITPIYNDQNRLKGYISANRAAGEKDIKEMKQKYLRLKAEETRIE